MKQRRSYVGKNNPCYKHGWSKTKIYAVWAQMKQRCSNSNYKEYHFYDGRGITICNEWLEFIPFRDWALNNGYQEGLEIDRIDNNGNYETSNCRWVSSAKNSQNRRTNKLTLELADEIRTLYKTENYSYRKLAKKYGINFSTVHCIIKNKIWYNTFSIKEIFDA